MKKFTIMFLALLSLFALSCSTDSQSDDATDDSASITLASENQEYFPLRASFMSDNRTMVYAFNYDGNLLKMIGSPEGTSEYGATFMVEGGAKITSSTFLIDGFEEPVSGEEGACEVTYASADHDHEVLVLRLEVCEDDNAALGEEALQALLDELTLEKL